MKAGGRKQKIPSVHTGKEGVNAETRTITRKEVGL